MQTIQIENELYNKLIKCGIDIQFELQKLVDDFKAFKLSEEEIKKTVENSQRIEGYESASKEVKERVKTLMEKHSVKVSF